MSAIGNFFRKSLLLLVLAGLVFSGTALAREIDRNEFIEKVKTDHPNFEFLMTSDNRVFAKERYGFDWYSDAFWFIDKKSLEIRENDNCKYIVAKVYAVGLANDRYDYSQRSWIKIQRIAVEDVFAVNIKQRQIQELKCVKYDHNGIVDNVTDTPFRTDNWREISDGTLDAYIYDYAVKNCPSSFFGSFFSFGGIFRYLAWLAVIALIVFAVRSGKKIFNVTVNRDELNAQMSGAAEKAKNVQSAVKHSVKYAGIVRDGIKKKVKRYGAASGAAFCRKCGAKISRNELFCGNCGAKIDWSGCVFCPKCGAESAADSAFCEKCGASLQPSQKQPEPVQTVAHEAENQETETAAEQTIQETENKTAAKKKIKKKLVSIVGIAVVIICAAVFGAVKYSEYEIKNLREKGEQYLGAEKYTEAYDFFSKAAEKGDAVSMYNLGLMYVDGMGLSQDGVKAQEWYRKAAEKGSTEAMRDLGKMYFLGKGTQQNYKEAAKWFKQAADNENAEGMRLFGDMCKLGLGMEQSNSEAAKWYKKAMEKGDLEAMCFLGVMYDKGEGVAQNSSEAVKLFKQAAENGSVTGKIFLGDMYARGAGVQQDYGQALKLYEEAAEKDSILAMQRLSIMHLEGNKAVQQDFQKAVYWLERAADAGDKESVEVLQKLRQNAANNAAVENTAENATGSPIQINGTRVNMRQSPSMNAPVVYQFPGYEFVTATEKTEAGGGKYPWYKVSYNGYTGWVYGQFVR